MNGQFLGNEKALFQQAIEDINHWALKNNQNLSKIVDFELVQVYLKAVQKLSPQKVSIIKDGQRLALYFYPTDERVKKACNEILSKDGCINALIKARKVKSALEYFAKTDKGLKEFWDWYNFEILDEKELKNNIVTVSMAIEKVKENFFNETDKCGRQRNTPELITNSLANWQTTYQMFYNRIPNSLLEKQVTAKLLIEVLETEWKDLMAKKTKGFKNAHSAIQKLLIENKLLEELKTLQEHFGKIEVKSKQEVQEVSLELFLEFRARVLGIAPYTLTKAQFNQLENRKSCFKALSINLIYGFRGSEFKAIANLDKPVRIGNRTFKALYDPTNTENLIVLNDKFTVTDSEGNERKATIKTGDRICRPMVHPDYPNLINDLEIKDPSIKLPSCVPNANSKPITIKNCTLGKLQKNLSKYIGQCGMGFTQTHALRHLCNFHGKLLGLTKSQRSKSLGHSETMNDKYDKHLDAGSEAEFLLRTIETPEAENARLKLENQQLREENEFLKREIANLKSLLITSNKVVELKKKR